jgi:Immunity protein 49
MFGEACESLAYEIGFWMQGLEDPSYPLDETASLTREICSHLRSLAIMVLLSKGNSDRFHHNLIRSGRLRLAYLQRVVREAAVDQHDFVSGVFDPLVDAIAAGEIRLAQQLAWIVPLDHRPGHEYEDDHCYGQILGLLLQGRQADAEVSALLARMEAYLGRPDDPRVGVCRALLGSDQAAFDAAFNAFLDARTRVIEADEARGELAEPPVLAQRTVYVDGLAMLRLAEMRGFGTSPDHLYCPSMARQPMVDPCPEV